MQTFSDLGCLINLHQPIDPFQKKFEGMCVKATKLENVLVNDITYITRNRYKADYLAKYLGYPLEHRKLDIDEIQSLDLETIVRDSRTLIQ